MININLHALANQGGFGDAQKILQEAGAWNECASNPFEKLRTFRVIVSGQVSAYTTLLVKATNEEHAEAKASATLNGNIQEGVFFDGVWDTPDDEPDHFSIDDVEDTE